MKKLLILCVFLLCIYGGYVWVLKNVPSSLPAPTPAVVQEIPKAPQIETPKAPNTMRMFRGNISRNFYGVGPVPSSLSILWKYPKENPLCARSWVGSTSKIWCGNGWTGQPVLWEKDGRDVIVFNAYDKGIHFVYADTGETAFPTFYTGDIIKGTVSLDPDGYPLLYSGSRDNFFRIISLDGDKPRELYKIEAKISDGYWNNDWDPNAIIENDILYTGAENGLFHILKLNRAYDADGKVTVAPSVLIKVPSFNTELLENIGDEDVSIESSPLKIGNTVYIANSGGRILGMDVSRVIEGLAPIVFDFWTGDDTDATLVTDDKGYIYAASERERINKRSDEVGQIMKLDPRNTANPLVWGVPVLPKQKGIDGGVWATPAIHNGKLYVPTNPGDLLVIDTDTGTVLQTISIGVHAWSSPNIVDEKLILTTCEGYIKVFSIGEALSLDTEMQIPSKACIESTPLIWNGGIYFGARDGFIYKVGEKE